MKKLKILLIILGIVVLIAAYWQIISSLKLLGEVVEDYQTEQLEQQLEIEGIDTNLNDLQVEIKNMKSNRWIYKGTFTTTAYCGCSKCCGKWAGGTTAFGTVPKAGRTIAVDTRVIPHGTRVLINGLVYTAEDTGGAVKGNRIDIFFNSHQEAVSYGRKEQKVYV